MRANQESLNHSAYNCTTSPREYKVPQITHEDCLLIGSPVSQIFSNLYYVISCLGILANLIKLICIARDGPTWTTRNISMVNLAFSHLLFLACFPFWGLYLSRGYDWQLGREACISMNFIIALGHGGSTLFVCIICVDQMVSIYFPMTSVKHRKLKCGKLIALVAWVLSGGVAAFNLVYTMYSGYKHSKHYCGTLFITSFTDLASIRSLLLFSSTNLVLPVLIVIPSYAKILAYLALQHSRETRLPMDIKKALKVDIGLVTVFLIGCFSTSVFLSIGCILYVTSPGCQNECAWANITNSLHESAKLLNICYAAMCPLLYLPFFKLTRCSSFCQRPAVKICLCDCSGNPTEEVPAVQLVYISCTLDDV